LEAKSKKEAARKRSTWEKLGSGFSVWSLRGVTENSKLRPDNCRRPGAILNERAQGKASNGRNSWPLMAEPAEEAKTCERHDQHEPQDAGRAL
jgi:hypothetical protein